MNRILIFTAILGFALHSQARVFSFGQESFAAYFKAGQQQGIENLAMSNSNGTVGNPATVTESFAQQLSGEFGFVYASPYFNVRFGVEVIRGEPIEENGASGATTLYALNSQASAIIPKIVFEWTFFKRASQRMYLAAGAGSASLTARNSYTMTVDGNTAYNPITDFVEDLRGTAAAYEGGLGYEFLLSDTTTMSLEAGYRSLNFLKLTHNKAASTFTGSVAKGDVALNTDGTDRTLNLTGVTALIGFKFWIN